MAHISVEAIEKLMAEVQNEDEEEDADAEADV